VTAPATVVIPMAGRGQRFADAGYEAPKPLIDVRGRPMYSWAVDSIPASLVGRMVFVCLAEHLATYPLADDIRERYAAFDPVVIALDHVTEGQACTVLEASEHLDPDAPLIVYNADTYCVTDLEQTLAGIDGARGAGAPGGADADEVAGVIGVFEAPGDHWSFARLDERGHVVETAEKRRISPWATTGLYHFSRAGDFVDTAHRMIADDDRVNGEFYVAPMYNRLIGAGRTIVVDRAREVWVLGTPAELATFEAGHPVG
jgi:dTDP-glucose pyrophosphorylase